MNHICACGCGKEISFKKHYNWAGFPKYIHGHTWRLRRSYKGKANPNYGKKASEKCKEVNHYRLLGKKGKKSIAYGIKHPHLTALNKSRIGIPISDNIKNKQRESILKYWNSSKGTKQKKKLSKINKKWAQKNPNKKIEAAKNGHKSCPRISSLELQFQKILKQNHIKFISQYEYDLGFIDFFIKPNIAIFIDGNYWHKYPYGTKKDKKQTCFLKNKGYTVLRIWENELKNPNNLLDKIINFNEG
jgi:very-short-patch-repair endonuclease